MGTDSGTCACSEPWVPADGGPSLAWQQREIHATGVTGTK